MAIVDGKIRCYACGEAKPLADHFPSSVKNGRGRCRSCNRAAGDAWVLANPEKARARQVAASKAYRRRMPESAKQKRNALARAWVRENPDKSFAGKCLRKFGMTFADYEAMIVEQGGGCACCGAATNKSGRRLGVDHDHRTGAVRGILCHHCNAGLGHFDDDPARLQMAIDYLVTHGNSPPPAKPFMRINLLGGTTHVTA